MSDKKRYHILIIAEDTDEIKKITFSRKWFKIIVAMLAMIVFTVVLTAFVFFWNYSDMNHDYAPIYSQFQTTKKQNLQLRNELENVYQKYRDQKYTFMSWQQRVTGEIGNLHGKINRIARLYQIPEEKGSGNKPQISMQEYARRLYMEDDVSVMYDLTKKIMDTLELYDGVLTKEEQNSIYYFIGGLEFIQPATTRITSYFGGRWDPINGMGASHTGLDFAGPMGTPIMAAESGFVEYAGQMTEYGNIVIIKHNGSVSTRYAHMQGFTVTPGQQVNKGDVIGYVGATGRVTGAHLHFEVRINDQAIDPLKVLRG